MADRIRLEFWEMDGPRHEKAWLNKTPRSCHNVANRRLIRGIRGCAFLQRETFGGSLAGPMIGHYGNSRSCRFAIKMYFVLYSMVVQDRTWGVGPLTRKTVKPGLVPC